MSGNSGPASRTERITGLAPGKVSHFPRPAEEPTPRLLPRLGPDRFNRPPRRPDSPFARRERRRPQPGYGTRWERRLGDYFPSFSIFCFSSSFICLIFGFWFVEPVFCVVVAGGAAFGNDLCPAGSLAGRVAVALGAVSSALAEGAKFRLSKNKLMTASIPPVAQYLIGRLLNIKPLRPLWSH